MINVSVRELPYVLKPVIGFLLLFNPLLVLAEQNQNPDQILKEAERFFRLDNWMKARPLFATAERLFAQKGDTRNALFAKVSRLRADSETILSFPEVSRYLAQELKNPLVKQDLQLKLRCLVVKAAADLSINDPLSSGREWSEALAIARQLADRGWEGRILGELSIVSFLKGETAKAVEQNQRAYEIAKELHDVAGQIRSRSLKGVGFIEQGQHEQATMCFDEALEIATNNPDVRFPLMAYMGKSQALELQGHSRQSKDLLEEARQYVNQTNMSVYKADLLIALGNNAVRGKDYTGAMKLFEDAAESAQKAGMPRPYADASFQLADLLLRAGDLRTAERKVFEGLKASRELVDMYVLPRHLAAAAEIESRLGKITRACELYDEAGDLLESLMLNVPSAPVKSALIGTMNRVYVGYFRVALNSEHNLSKAFYILEQARGRVVADRLRARPLWSDEAPIAITAAERKVAEIQTRLLHVNSADERRLVMRELNRAEQELTPAVLARFKGAININGKPVTIPALQRILRTDELILEYVVDEPESVCLVVTNKTVRPYLLPGRSALEKLVNAYLTETKDTAATAPSSHIAAHNLYQVLLDPIKESFSKTRLIIVADGQLNFVRFDSLVNARGQYLVETHVTSYVPSATVLALLRTQAPKSRASLPLLAFGDPSTGLETTATVNPLGSRRARGLYDLEGATFGPLPSAAAEVRSIADLAGPRSRVFLGAAATENAFKSQPLQEFRVLHLAAHAFTDTQFPDRSAVFLGGSGALGDDGLLQVREIRDLHLNADLVTLSACDTGVGKLQGLDGMASIVSAFLFAGSRAIVASLWAVDDTFTASLMTRFYRHLSDGEDTGTALQQAKLDMLRRFGQKALPLYWGGVFLSGDGNRRIMFKQ